MLLNGVAVWGAALKSKVVVKQLRSVQAMAAKAMTRCFKSALALAGLPPVDLVGKEMVMQQYTHGKEQN